MQNLGVSFRAGAVFFAVLLAASSGGSQYYFEDLSDELQKTVMACVEDEQSAACRSARTGLSEQDAGLVDEWLRKIRMMEAKWAICSEREAVWARLKACRTCPSSRCPRCLTDAEKRAIRESDRGFDARLAELDPSLASFYETVTTRLPQPDEPCDAVIIFAEYRAVWSLEKGKPRKDKRLVSAGELIDNGMAREALLVTLPPSSDYVESARERYSGRITWGFENEVTARYAERKDDECSEVRSSKFARRACRRDLKVVIAAEWMKSRGHDCARLVFDAQSEVPEYLVLMRELAPEVSVQVDPEFRFRPISDYSFSELTCGTDGVPGYPSDDDIYANHWFYERTLRVLESESESESGSGRRSPRGTE